MTKTSQRAGLLTSVLVVVFFFTAIGFRMSGGDVPSWFPITMGAILCVTTVSAVVCLVTTWFAFYRGRRRRVDGTSSIIETQHGKNDLDP